MPSPSPLTVALVDGVRVVVPDSLDLITPYVLLEQEDWFEDEIKFLRRLLQPGQTAIDIGANFGVYTLSLARTVGPTGRVWAFEPATDTIGMLARSVAVNGYPHVVLERCALSNTGGTAVLSLDAHPEKNALLHGAPGSGRAEAVPVTTLDDCMQRHGWRQIDFIKIDAEGEEANILEGGARFFSETSALVQFEIRAQADVHLELVDAFAALGYRSYRLVPGLDLLAPFDAGAPDGYLLNLFCCKPDRARSLAAGGYLLEEGERLLAQARVNAEARARREAYDWRRAIAGLAYASRLAEPWERATAAGKCAELEHALALYAVSRDAALPPAERFGALGAGLVLLRTLCEREASRLRLASLARMARDYGARSLAVGALQHLADAVLQRQPQRADAAEPFLAPGERFDSVAPGDSIGTWALAAVMEELERLDHFSSFYGGAEARHRLEAIRDLGFAGPEMARRLALVCKRFGPG